MRVRHASPDMVQAPSSPSTLIGDDIPNDTHSEMKVPLPSKQHYNSQTSLTASLQGLAHVPENAPFPPADAFKLVLEQRQRDASNQSQKLLEDGRRRAMQVLNKPGAWCNILERRRSHASRAVLGLQRSIVRSQDRQDLGSRPGCRKIKQLTDSNSLEKKAAFEVVQEKSNSGDVKASLNANGHRPKKLIVKLPFKYPLSDKRPWPKDQAENSADIKTSLNPKEHRPKKLIIKLPLKAPIGCKRPLPADEVEEGDKEMAGAIGAINPEEAPPGCSSCTEEGAKT